MKPSDENRDSTGSPRFDGDQEQEPVADSPPASDSPTIRTFRRHAAAIIAADRGLTDHGRKKLEALALRLGMNESQQREAFAQLQQRSSDMDDSLSHWERAYVTLLKKQFSEIKHGILTVSIETRAIELAKRKYQINEVRAQLLIGQVVEELGMGRIEHSDAQQFGVRLISDLVGRQTELDDEFRRRLFREGKKWGLDKTQIDQVIAETIRESRRGRGNQRKGSRLPIIVTASVILAIATAVFFYFSRSARLQPGDNTSLPAIREGEGRESTPVQPSLTAWWDDDMKTSYQKLETLAPDVAERFLILAGEPDPTRALIADELEFAADDPAEQAKADMLAGWYLRDPSPGVARAILERLMDELEQSLAARPVTRSSIRKSQALHGWVDRVVNKLDQSSNAEPQTDASGDRRSQRVQELLSRVAEVYGQTATVEMLPRLNRMALARFWNAALEDALDRPLSAAYLVGVLIDESNGLIPDSEIQALADEVVGAILEIEPSHERILRPVISRLIERASDSQLERWKHRLTTLRHSEAADFIAVCLARRAGINREISDPDEVAAELERLRAQSQTGPRRAWMQLNAKLESMMVRIQNLVPNSGSRSPQQIAYIVHGVQSNLEMIAAYYDPVSEEFGLVEQLPLLTNFQSRESQEDQVYSAASPSQLRELARMIERLKNSQNDQLATRESALKRLAALSDVVPALSVEQANDLATWILGPHGDAEALVLEQVTPQLSQWPRLIIAIADRLDSVDIPLDTALTLFNRITEQTFELPRSAEWKSAMQLELLKYAAARVHRRSVAPSNNQQRDWNRLQKYMMQSRGPRQRCVDRIEQPIRLNQASVSRQYERPVPFPAIAQINRRWEYLLLESEHADSLQQWIIQSRVLLEWVEQKIEDAAGSDDQRVRFLKQKYQDAVTRCSSSGDLLGETEWYLLEALNLWRTILAEQAGGGTGVNGS